MKRTKPSRPKPIASATRAGVRRQVRSLLFGLIASLSLGASGAGACQEQQASDPHAAVETAAAAEPSQSNDQASATIEAAATNDAATTFDTVTTIDDPACNAILSATESLRQNPQLRPSIQTGLTFAMVALVPIVLLMTTGYIRLAVVLGLLRQGFGATTAPPPQVTTALAVFLTALVMMPVWQQVKRDAIDPYLATVDPLPLAVAVDRGVVPIKRFMSQQIIAAGNTQDVWLFLKYLPESQRTQTPRTFSEVPLQVLIPAFMVSELKVAFAIGFQIFLPFLVIDLIVSSVITSLGLITLSPTVVSLPLKLAVFVMVDGWNLIVGMLLNSFVSVV